MHKEQLNGESIEEVDYEELNDEIIEDIGNTPYDELIDEVFDEVNYEEPLNGEMIEGFDDYHEYEGEPPVIIPVVGELTILDNQTCEFEMSPEYVSELPNVQYSVAGFTVKGTDHTYREINTYCAEMEIDQAMFDSICYEKEADLENYFLSINGGDFIRTDFKS